MPELQSHSRVYSHRLLHVPPGDGPLWRSGYRAGPGSAPGVIRVSRAVALQIGADMRALRAEALAIAAHTGQSYEHSIRSVDARLPRIDMDGQHLVGDWRHVTGDDDAVRVSDTDPDGRYTFGAGLGWQPVDARRCPHP